MLIAVSVILLICAISHSYLGERYLLRRLFKMPMAILFGNETFTKGTIRFAWHITSVAWLGLAAILLVDNLEWIVIIVGLVLLISGVISLFYTKAKHFSWVLFLAGAVLCLIEVMV